MNMNMNKLLLLIILTFSHQALSLAYAWSYTCESSAGEGLRLDFVESSKSPKITMSFSYNNFFENIKEDKIHIKNHGKYREFLIILNSDHEYGISVIIPNAPLVSIGARHIFLSDLLLESNEPYEVKNFNISCRGYLRFF